MKISVVDYNPQWPVQFENIKTRLAAILHAFDPEIEHIGSTAVPGLSAKPVIDVAVGLSCLQDLDKIIEPMINTGHIYYALYNALMPDRRLFVQLKNQEAQQQFQAIYHEEKQVPQQAIHQARIANIHVWVKDSEDWLRHIAFREYLKHFPSVSAQYGQLKQKLSYEDWENMASYHAAKNEFIQAEEALAIRWYQQRKS